MAAKKIPNVKHSQSKVWGLISIMRAHFNAKSFKATWNEANGSWDFEFEVD